MRNVPQKNHSCVFFFFSPSDCLHHSDRGHYSLRIRHSDHNSFARLGGGNWGNLHRVSYLRFGHQMAEANKYFLSDFIMRIK